MFGPGYLRTLMQPRDLLPWRELTIETRWSPDVAAAELAERIGKRTFFGGGDTLFVGDRLNEREFRFSRRIAYRNSFVPVIRAVVEASDHGGSRIRIRMKLHALVMPFMAFWMTGATCGGLPAGIASLWQRNVWGLIGLALPVFGAALVTVPFAIEAQSAERLLRDLFASAPNPGAEASPPDIKWR
jgi:hypothetical protein